MHGKTQRSLRALALLATLALPTRADAGTLDVISCLAFVSRWCDIARDEATWYELPGIGVLCAVERAKCLMT